MSVATLDYSAMKNYCCRLMLRVAPVLGLFLAGGPATADEAAASNDPDFDAAIRTAAEDYNRPLSGDERTLPHLLGVVGAVDPTEAWKARARTASVFSCSPPKDGETVCSSKLSVFGQQGDEQANGLIDVLTFDHDIDFETEFAKIKAANDAFTATRTPDVAYTTGTGSREIWPTSCGQTLGAKNEAALCYSQIDTRTGIYVAVRPAQVSAANDNQRAQTIHDLARALDVLVLGGNLVHRLMEVARNPDAAKRDIPVKYGVLVFSGPGWYAHNTAIMGDDLFAGPYAQGADCRVDLARVDASATAQGAHNHVTECARYERAP